MRFFAQVVACRAGPGSLRTCAEPPACQGRFLAGGGGAGQAVPVRSSQPVRTGLFRW